MSNVLSEEKRQQVIALGRLGWSLRRIEQATGVRRETGSAYLKAAGIAVRAPGASGRQVPAKAANEVTTGSQPELAAPNDNINPENLPNKRKSNRQDSKPVIQVTTGFGVGWRGTKSENPKSPSACEAFREFIELGLSRGRNAMAIWQDLLAETGFRDGYGTVKRFVRKLRRDQPLEARAVIVTAQNSSRWIVRRSKACSRKFTRSVPRCHARNRQIDITFIIIYINNVNVNYLGR